MSIFTRAEKMQMLREAKLEYHALSTGSKLVVMVDQNGERMEYNRAGAANLLAYIRQLERELGLGAASGAIGVWM